jgi:cytidine deaminase
MAAQDGNDCLHLLNSYLYQPDIKILLQNRGRIFLSVHVLLNQKWNLYMAIHHHSFDFEVFENITQLNDDDVHLLLQARDVTERAYAPYSRFHVGAAARLQYGATIASTNQENASYPVGICAERTLLGTLSSIYPGVPVDTIAITYVNHATGGGDQPASPCGLCRQTLFEYEQRMGQPIRLILAGPTGVVVVIKSVKDLLPFGFGPDDLKR